MNALVKVISLLTILFSLLGISYLSPEAIKTKYIYPKLDQNTFLLVTDDSYGTSFQVNYGDGYLVTSGHACEKSKNGMVVVKLPSGDKQVIVLKIDKSNDICLLEKINNDGLTLSSETSEYVKVFTIGYPNTFVKKQFYEGNLLFKSKENIMASYVYDELDYVLCTESGKTVQVLPNGISGCFRSLEIIQSTIRSGPGASGSPVSDMLGNVVSMINGFDNVSSLAITTESKHIISVIDKYESEDPAKKRVK